MSLAGILADLKALIAPLPNIGQVYDYERIAVEPQDVRTVYGFDDATYSKGWAIRVWMIDRDTTAERRLTNRETEQRHTIALQGYWEVNDPAGSRVAVREATELIVTTLRATYALSGQAELVEAPQVVEDKPLPLGETYLAHSVRIIILAQDLTTP